MITAEVRTNLDKIDVYVQGTNTESRVVRNHILELNNREYKIKKFYGDGAYDNYQMFNLLDKS